MLAELLAILTSLLWALQNICAKKGLKESNVISLTLFTVAIGSVFFWVLTILFVPLDSFKSEAIIYHIIGGALGGFIALQLWYKSMKRYGVARASTIVSSRTLVSSFAAVLILDELLTPSIGVGTVLIVLGVALLSSEGYDKTGWLDRNLILPLATAFFYGINAIPRKIGVGITNNPIVGATIETSTALILIIIYLFLSKSKFSLNRSSFSYFSVNGVFYSIAYLCLVYAYSFGDLVIVVPLMSIFPLFTILLVYFLLGEQEKITSKLIISAILVVLGSVLII